MFKWEEYNINCIVVISVFQQLDRPAASFACCHVLLLTRRSWAAANGSEGRRWRRLKRRFVRTRTKARTHKRTTKTCNINTRRHAIVIIAHISDVAVDDKDGKDSKGSANGVSKD